MKVAITNDEGEVYAILRDVHAENDATGVDEEGEVCLISQVLRDAAVWDRVNQPSAPRWTP